MEYRLKRKILELCHSYLQNSRNFLFSSFFIARECVHSPERKYPPTGHDHTTILFPQLLDLIRSWDTHLSDVLFKLGAGIWTWLAMWDLALVTAALRGWPLSNFLKVNSLLPSGNKTARWCTFIIFQCWTLLFKILFCSQIALLKSEVIK